MALNMMNPAALQEALKDPATREAVEKAMKDPQVEGGILHTSLRPVVNPLSSTHHPSTPAGCFAVHGAHEADASCHGQPCGSETDGPDASRVSESRPPGAHEGRLIGPKTPLGHSPPWFIDLDVCTANGSIDWGCGASCLKKGSKASEPCPCSFMLLCSSLLITHKSLLIAHPDAQRRPRVR